MRIDYEITSRLSWVSRVCPRFPVPGFPSVSPSPVSVVNVRPQIPQVS